MTAPEVKVTQADRDAAAEHLRGAGFSMPAIAKGQLDDGALVQAFARHRIAAEAAQLDALREAREALEAVRDDLQIVAEPPLVDPCLLVDLRAMCSKHGYGNVMVSASALWRYLLQEQEGGAFVAGPSVAAVRNRLKEIGTALASLTAAIEGKG